MNQLENTGKKRTILISISILLVSIHTIYFYHSIRPDLETKKLGQQIIRFFLTAGVLFAVYKGKNWAKIILLILLSIAVVGAIVAAVTLEQSIINKVPLFVMIFVYSMAIYHFSISKSFKAFFKKQI